MKNSYLNIYNNLIKLTRNKSLFYKIAYNESFSDRMVIFLLHFAFFLKEYKIKNSKDELQSIYDFIFKQIEANIRELGHGDMSVNKKMKSYINLFHSIISKIDVWNELNEDKKDLIFKELINDAIDGPFFVNYFEKYRLFLRNNTLNSFTKDILNFKI